MGEETDIPNPPIPSAKSRQHATSTPHRSSRLSNTTTNLQPVPPPPTMQLAMRIKTPFPRIRLSEPTNPAHTDNEGHH